MKPLLLAIILNLGIAAFTTASPVHLTQYAGGFDDEIAPTDNTQIVKEGGVVAAIKNNSWVRYNNFLFVDGASHFTIEAAAAAGAGGTIELRTDWDQYGTNNLIGQITIPSTGGIGNYQTFTCPISMMLEDKTNLILTFRGTGTGDLFKIRNFRFTHTGPVHPSGAYTTDSGDPQTPEATRVEFITDQSWVAYPNYTFPAGVNRFQIEAASPGTGGTVELRNGSPTGTLLGSAVVTNTGDWNAYRLFEGTLATSLPTSPIHLHMRFVRTPGSTDPYLFNTRYFRMASTLRVQNSVIAASSFNSKVDVTGATLSKSGFRVGNIKDGASVTYTGVDFGSGSNIFQVELASPSRAGKIEVRLGSATGTIIGTIFGSYTGSYTLHRAYTIPLTQVVSGVQTVTLKFVGYSPGNANMMDIRSFSFWNETLPAASPSPGNLNVYGNVPGLTDSPYYDIYVRKLSDFQGIPPETVSNSNWEKPFDWFTQCVDYPNVGDDTANDNAHKATFNSAYYSRFIGGWSHTYTNFEMDPDTEVVVKIVRKNPTDGAPGGNINTAIVRPIRPEISSQVIGGAVYVRLKNPALLTVDINGQMESRDTPRATEGGFNNISFPHASKAAGAHSLTIFANPFIKNKPAATGDPDVKYVTPGEIVPRTGTWKTLYFLPGVHHLSTDANGTPRPWQPADAYVPESNKSYYIPGNAIVYGNFSDNATYSWSGGSDEKNVRIFGHGTLSGQKIPHWQDFQSTDTSLLQTHKDGVLLYRPILKTTLHDSLRMLQVAGGEGCTFEGITVANPAEHGVYIQGYDDAYTPNKISWVKNISWRVNNDGGGVTGNGSVEDCFFRHQDDALYVRGTALRRCVMWSDVNGTPLRTSFIHKDRHSQYVSAIPQDTLVEDIDVVYCRGVFGSSTSTDFGVIGSPGAFEVERYFGEGTACMGQYVIFRNITVSDPRPVRYLLGFDADRDPQPNKLDTPWAGLRFQNVKQENKHTWGWKQRLMGGSVASGGTAAASIKFWVFEQVKINYGSGLDLLDASDLTNTSKFQIRNTNNLHFR